jgi:hypothetical protein
MKPTVEVSLPIVKVVELFMDKNNFKEWKKGYISYEHISGTPNEVGAVTKLVYKDITMFETITSKKLPTEIKAEYEHKRGEKTVMMHTSTYHFSSLGDNKTLIEVDMVTTRVFGVLMKLIMTLMAGAGIKYAQEQLNMFKVFAEKQK